MKGIALGLLAGAAALYALASWLQPLHPAWGYVAAFSEAAMVGAIADWFAVVALFRHPLGLPIPHTAIIPSNKDRIGRNLASFIVANFLSTRQVLEKLKRFDPGARLAGWLVAPGHAETVAGHLGATLRYALGALDDERVRQFFRATALEALDRLDTARLAGEWLGLLSHEQRHRPLLDALLRKLADLLDNDELKARLAEVIATEVKYLRFVGLDNVAGRFATTKMVAGTIRLIGEMADDPAHPLRGEFEAFMAGLVVRLKNDAELQRRIEALKNQLLANPALGAYLLGLWSDIVRWLQADLNGDASVLRAHVATAFRIVGEKLQADLGMRTWINEQLLAAAPQWIERYREDIRRYIVARVGDWNTEEMTDELERNIGRDLQFIRVNGTLVGGLVGLSIHAVTELSRAA
ncbi:DUF445 domain-containing protein [Aquincola sp. S2]|uniref:DUF445 domain-containing protein n=2 Tax=Pseudaquabacterium terrae TaxID=2732868 RepID=A0ABX2EPH7_9BURK|nr:DUF445 domain-containing protein [Aquabacterium terrae]NRF70605.1 DUF445 domain-containing protein [Aquabacterium terrae]